MEGHRQKLQKEKVRQGRKLHGWEGKRGQKSEGCAARWNGSFILMVLGSHWRLLPKVDLQLRKTSMENVMAHSNVPEAWGRCCKTTRIGRSIIFRLFLMLSFCCQNWPLAWDAQPLEKWCFFTYFVHWQENGIAFQLIKCSGGGELHTEKRNCLLTN